MPQDLTDDRSTLVQVMAWCRQATSHYLSQCWLSSLSPYGVARPQWVNSLRRSDAYMRRWTKQHWFRQWLFAWSVPSNCLNQCWNTVNWTITSRTNFSEILIEILTFSFKKMHLKVPSAKWRPFCLGLSVTLWYTSKQVIYIHIYHKWSFLSTPVQQHFINTQHID